jgi:hypothetical protein
MQRTPALEAVASTAAAVQTLTPTSAPRRPSAPVPPMQLPSTEMSARVARQLHLPSGTDTARPDSTAAATPAPAASAIVQGGRVSPALAPMAARAPQLQGAPATTAPVAAPPQRTLPPNLQQTTSSTLPTTMALALVRASAGAAPDGTRPSPAVLSSGGRSPTPTLVIKPPAAPAPTHAAGSAAWRASLGLPTRQPAPPRTHPQPAPLAPAQRPYSPAAPPPPIGHHPQARASPGAPSQSVQEQPMVVERLPRPTMLSHSVPTLVTQPVGHADGTAFGAGWSPATAAAAPVPAAVGWRPQTAAAPMADAPTFRYGNPPPYLVAAPPAQWATAAPHKNNAAAHRPPATSPPPPAPYSS